MKANAFLIASAVSVSVSCQDMHAPVGTSGYDPMGIPGSAGSLGEHIGGPQRIRPGEFAVAAIDNTAFFSQRPGPEAEADQLLKRGTSMKVISTAGSFHRVELDSGEVGFVPNVMVESANITPPEILELTTSRPSSGGSGRDYPEPPPPPLPEGLPSDFIPDVEPAPEPSPSQF